MPARIPLPPAVRALFTAFVLAVSGSALAGPPEQLQAARVLSGVDPLRALAEVRALRGTAQAQGRLDWRLEADEIECRIQSDMDNGAGLRVADAGLASAGATPPASARLVWLRLRACRAGVLVDGGGDVPAGEREFEAVLEAAAGPEMLPARSIALLERGVRRSRSGDLERGQRDLMAACDGLKQHGLAGDHDLCLGHLANHYRRMGDLDEALALTRRLRDAARARGAAYDEMIHVYALALIHNAREDWPAALAAYRESDAAFSRMNDVSGMAYAEHGIAMALSKTGHPDEALAQIETAMRRLKPGEDPKHETRMAQLHAELLLDRGRAAEARAGLAAMEKAARSTGEGPALASWLVAQARANQVLGHWREAFQLLDEGRTIEAALHKQRLSEQSARLRMQYNRARDAEDLSALRRLNEQGQRLRHTQALALGLFVILLLASSAFAWHKFRQARHLQALASTDELTGLPNRRALLAQAEDALAQARREGNSLAVLMVDVDHFKRINDSHGHAVGDDVLRHLARVLPVGLRGRDRLGRLGGEEFLAVLPGANLVHARQVAERMRSAIAATPLIGPSGDLRFTVSIGVAATGAAGETVGALVERADAALYRAKGAGRNAVVVDEAGFAGRARA